MVEQENWGDSGALDSMLAEAAAKRKRAKIRDTARSVTLVVASTAGGVIYDRSLRGAAEGFVVGYSANVAYSMGRTLLRGLGNKIREGRHKRSIKRRVNEARMRQS